MAKAQIVHEPPPPLEQVRAGVGRLDRILDSVRQRRLDDLARMVRLLGRPVRKLDRNPCGTQAMPQRASSRRSCGTASRRPLRLGNTSGPSPSVRAAARIASARPHSGTRWSRFIFIRVAGMVHTWSAVSISSHAASRTSPDRAAVSTKNSNASVTAAARLTSAPSRAPRRPPGAATPACCCTMLRWGPSTGPTRSDGLSVRRFMAMAHSSTVWIRCLTVLAMTGLVCQMGGEDREHVGAGHLRDRPAADARERVAFQAASPRLHLRGGLPPGPLLVDHRGRGLGEGGRPLDAALVGEWVRPPRAGRASGWPRPARGPRASETRADGAEAKFAAPAADDEALDPAAGPGRLDVEVEYLSMRYTDRLVDTGIAPGVGSQGDADDRALAESVIGVYKTEMIRRKGPWRTLEAVEFATVTWVGLVQHATPVGASRGHSASRVRGAVLCPGRSGLIQQIRSPMFPVRFRKWWPQIVRRVLLWGARVDDELAGGG